MSCQTGTPSDTQEGGSCAHCVCMLHPSRHFHAGTNREKAALAVLSLSLGTALAQGERVQMSGWLVVSWMLLWVHYGEQLILKPGGACVGTSSTLDRLCLMPLSLPQAPFLMRRQKEVLLGQK